MKKRKVTSKLLQLATMLIVLTSCAPKNDGHIVIPLRSTKNISSENYTIAITKERLDAFIGGKRSFILYVMSPSCGACKKVGPRFAYYVDKTKVEMYELDISSTDFKTHGDYYTKTLNLRVTPTILLFENGQVVEKVEGANTFSNNDDVINYFGDRIKRTKLFIKDEDAKLSTRKRAVIYTFNFDNQAAQLFFNETFYPLVNMNDYTTYLHNDSDADHNFLITFTTNETSFNLVEPFINSEEVVIYLKTYFT